MNAKFLSINSDWGTKQPRIILTGIWLPQIGFTPGVLIQALPETNGMVFRTCDENIHKYSDLAKDTLAKGGKLLQVCCDNGLTLATSGKHIRAAGLNVGDFCIVGYDFGIIRIRKLPPQTKVLNPKIDSPKLRMICGSLLTDNGFIHYSLVAVSSEPGEITFLLQDQSVKTYRDVVKYARENKMNLMQVTNRAGVISLRIPDLSLHKAGFSMSDSFIVHYDYGVITLKKPDYEALGF